MNIGHGFDAVLGARGTARKAGAGRAPAARALTDRERCRELCDELDRRHALDELPTDADIEERAFRHGFDLAAIHLRYEPHRTHVGFLVYRDDPDAAIAILLEAQLDDHWHCRLFTEDRG